MGIGLITVSPEGTYTWTNKFTIAADSDLDFKPQGITMDWSTVTAVAGSPVTLPDGQVVAIGEKYARYGTVVYREADGRYRVATDVTQLIPGECGVLLETITDAADESPNFGGVVVGGTVYKDRLFVGGAGEPAWAAFYAALPNIKFFVA